MSLKKWCKNNYNKVLFVSLCVFSSIVYIQFIIGHYATDTYNIAYVGYDTYMKNWYLTDGRIFSAMFLFIMKIFNLSVENANTISLLFAIVITNISVMKIFNWTEKYVQIKNIKEKIILLIICYVIFWNFTYIENMYFLESSIMALSVLFYTMSAISLVEKNKYSFLKALMFAILGIISYQGTIGFLFILTALLTFIKNPKNYKANIVDIVKSTLEKTPPELSSDIMEKGIVLAGGGALIKNLDKLLSIETGMPVYIAEEPLDCVVRGTGKTLEDLERLKSVLVNSRKRR